MKELKYEIQVFLYVFEDLFLKCRIVTVPLNAIMNAFADLISVKPKTILYNSDGRIIRFF